MIILTGASCSKLFLKRKYTEGKFFAFKKHKPSASSENTSLISVATTDKLSTKAVQVKEIAPLNFPAYKDGISNKKKESVYTDSRHLGSFSTAKSESEEKEKYLSPSLKKQKSGLPCSGLWYVSPEAQLAGFCVSIAALLVFYPLLLGITVAAGLKILLSLAAAVLSVIGIVIAFSAMSEGGFKNVLSSIGTIILGLVVLAVCAIVFLI